MQSTASTTGRRRRRDGLRLALLAALPVVAMLALVLRYGVDLPFWDEWDLAGRLDELRNGAASLEPLTRPHNEHRLFFPLSVLALVAWLSSWNVRWQLAINGLLLVLGLPALLRLTRSTLGDRRAIAAVFLFGVVLLFHPAAVENWTWSWQLQIFLLVVMTLWTVALLSAEPLTPRRLALAVGAAFVASFSFASGLLLWPLGLLILGFGDREARRRAALWLAAAAITVALFFVGRPVEPRGAGAEPGSIVLYAFSWLGSPFWGRTDVPGVAASAGGLGLMALVALALTARSAWRRRSWRGSLALGGFALVSAFVTASGRAAFGQEQALASRYVTISSLFWIGLALLVAQRWEETESRARRRALLVSAVPLAVVGIVGLALRLPADLAQFDGQARHRAWLQAELRRGVLSEPAASALYPRRERLERFLELTCRDRLSVFRRYASEHELSCDFSPERAAPERQRWRLEVEPGGSALRSQRGYRLPVRSGLDGALRRPRTSADRCWAGWAWDEEFDERVAEVIVLVDGASRAAVLRRPLRPARAASEADPRLEASGIRVCLAEPPEGPVRLFAVSRRGGHATQLPVESGSETGPR